MQRDLNVRDMINKGLLLLEYDKYYGVKTCFSQILCQGEDNGGRGGLRPLWSDEQLKLKGSCGWYFYPVTRQLIL